MKTFEHFNQSSICPICGTKDDKTAVLIPIDDTDDGGICKGMQVHFDCINLLLPGYSVVERMCFQNYGETV